MRNIGGYVTAFICLIIAILAVDSCVEERSARDRNDKALQAARQDSITVNQKVDSSLKAAETMRLKNDSLQKAITALQQERKGVSGELAKSKARVIDLVALIGTYKESGDVQGKLMNCDSLVEENMNLIGLVTEYETYTDSVERLHADSYRLRDSIDKARLKLIGELRDAYNRVAANYLQLLNQPVKKEKRFSVGPAVGGGIGSGLKPAAFGGITIQYSLFKF